MPRRAISWRNAPAASRRPPAVPVLHHRPACRRGRCRSTHTRPGAPTAGFLATKPCRYSAAVTLPAIVVALPFGNVGNPAGQVTQVRSPQRHAPQRVAAAVAGIQPCIGDHVVIAVKRRQIRTQRDSRGAGQGREIHHQCGVQFAGAGQRIAQHQAAFRIGVVDLHAHALAGSR